MRSFIVVTKTIFWSCAFAWPLHVLAQLPTATAVNFVQAELVAEWTITVADDARQRTLRISSVSAKSGGAFLATGKYGYSGENLKSVNVSLTESDTAPQLKLTTPANSLIVASRLPDGSYSGTMALANGTVKAVFIRKLPAQNQQTTAAASADLPTSKSPGQTIEKSRIRFINMGGNDCPPCVAWRALELPKLQTSTVFKGVNYSYVIKAIGSPVPSEMFLDAEVKPLKAKLDTAGGRAPGSAQQVLVVDNEVYDYWFGSKDAKDVEARVTAISSGTPYPGPRCVRYFPKVRTCAEVK